MLAENKKQLKLAEERKQIAEKLIWKIIGIISRKMRLS